MIDFKKEFGETSTELKVEKLEDFWKHLSPNLLEKLIICDSAEDFRLKLLSQTHFAIKFEFQKQEERNTECEKAILNLSKHLEDKFKDQSGQVFVLTPVIFDLEFNGTMIIFYYYV